eukprot:gene7731-9507_t
MKFILCLILLISISSSVYSQQCNFKNPKGDVLDFSGLTQKGPFNITSPTKKGIYYTFNICGNTPCKSDFNPTSVCQINGNSEVHFGDPSNYTITALAGNEYAAVLTYYTKNKCQNTLRKSVINMICSNSDTVVVDSLDDKVPCLATIQITVPCGVKIPVPKTGGIGGGWIFVIILLSATAAYILFGTIINWKVRNQTGKEIFPNYPFWSNFGTLVKDGVYYIKGKISGTEYRGTYQQV